jgi:hypothetical protein
MKKALIVLLALCFVGAFASAEDAAASAAPKASISGSVGTGVVVGTDGTSIGINLARPDTSDSPYFASVSFGLSDANWGVSTTIKTGDFSGSDPVVIDSAMGWFKVFGMLTVKIGQFSEDVAHSYIDWAGPQWGVDQLTVEIAPVAGLTIYAEAYGLTTAQIDLATSKAYQFGIAYDSAAFGFHAVYDLGGNYADASFNLGAVPGLTAALDFYASNLDTTAVLGAKVNLGYDLGGGLSVGVKVGDADFSLNNIWIEPRVDFTVGPIAGEFRFGYTTGTNAIAAILKGSYSIEKVSLTSGVQVNYTTALSWDVFTNISYSWAL